MESRPSRSELEQLVAERLPRYGVVPDRAMASRMAHYLELVVEGQARARLVGSADGLTLVERHLGESVYFGTLVDLANATIVDVGTGAGFPGLALALGWNGLKVTLVEATGKKALFLKDAVVALGLEGRVRVENTHMGKRPPEGGNLAQAADYITLRAVEKIDSSPDWIGNWIRPGAQCAFWVGEQMATSWRERFGNWRWSEFQRLPGSEARGIVLGEPA